MEAKHLLIPGPVPPDLQHSCIEVQRSHEAGSLLVSWLPRGLIMPCWWPDALHHAHKAPHHDAQHGINCMPPHYNALQCITLHYIALHCIIHTKLHTMMFSIASIVCLPLHPHLHVCFFWNAGKQISLWLWAPSQDVPCQAFNGLVLVVWHPISKDTQSICQSIFLSIKLFHQSLCQSTISKVTQANALVKGDTKLGTELVLEVLHTCFFCVLFGFCSAKFSRPGSSWLPLKAARRSGSFWSRLCKSSWGRMKGMLAILSFLPVLGSCTGTCVFFFHHTIMWNTEVWT